MKNVRSVLKKNKRQIAVFILSCFLSSVISSFIQPLISERVVFIQRTRVIELPTITEVHAYPQVSLHISAYAFVTVEFPNGTIKQLTPQESIQD